MNKKIKHSLSNTNLLGNLGLELLDALHATGTKGLVDALCGRSEDASAVSLRCQAITRATFIHPYSSWPQWCIPNNFFFSPHLGTIVKRGADVAADLLDECVGHSSQRGHHHRLCVQDQDLHAAVRGGGV